MTRMDLADFLERLRSYDPDHDPSERLRFTEIFKAFPEVLQSDEKRYPRVRMADFAEIGYCAYKGWHRGHGTELRRPTRTALKAANGKRIHEAKVAEDLKAVRKLPVATRSDLRNSLVDIAQIPELPALIRVGRLFYGSSIERAGRNSGDLVVTEIKTGSWVLMPDHLLQTWGYCVSAPSALLRVTGSNFRARGVRWSLSYPKEDLGPYPFTEKALGLVREGMRQFEYLFREGLATDVRVPHDPYGPSPRKCTPCAFSHACRWSRAEGKAS